MKQLFKNLPLALLVLTLSVGCGKDNSSGGSSGASSEPIAVDGIGNSSQNFQAIEEVKAAFNAKSMSSGVTQNLDVYHVGPYFGGKTTSGGIKVDYGVSGCLNLIFWQWGDCGQNYEKDFHKAQKDQMQQIVDSGRLLKVSPKDANSVSAQEATGVGSDLNFVYRNLTLSKNDILGDALQSGGGFYEPQITPATIILSDGTNVEGVAIFQPNTGLTYVLSTNLPVIANPLAVFNYYGGLQGYLSRIGPNITIQRIEYNQ